MNESPASAPRWSNTNRDQKALAILRTLQSTCGPSVTRGSWLDVGCGSGGIAHALSEHVDHIVGLDPEPWQSWVGLSSDRSNLSFQVAKFDGAELAVAESSFDVLICNQVYEHVEKPAQLISNISRVLKPEGVCYFAGPNLLWPIEPHVFWPLVHWLPRGFAHRLMRVFGSANPNALDAYSASLWTLQRWFDRAGLSAVNLMPARLGAELAMRNYPRAQAFAHALPPGFYDAVNPLAPGFVLLLSKIGISRRERRRSNIAVTDPPARVVR